MTPGIPALAAPGQLIRHGMALKVSSRIDPFPGFQNHDLSAFLRELHSDDAARGARSHDADIIERGTLSNWLHGPFMPPRVHKVKSFRRRRRRQPLVAAVCRRKEASPLVRVRPA